MFGRFRNAREAAANFDTPEGQRDMTPVRPSGEMLTLEKPQPISVTLKPLSDLSEYEAVAKTLGYNPPELAERKTEIARREVIEFLLDKGFPIYNNQQVHDFMTTLARKAQRVFVWARMRDYTHEEIERQRQAARHFAVLRSGFGIEDHVVREEKHGQMVSTPYSKRVPLEILKRAAAIKERFGQEVEFYVSDYAVVDPDPFIMVKRGACKHIVFGVWDEPTWGIPS